jgi:hypothetical protein
MRGQVIVSFVAGLLFSTGLALSGMTEPQKIIAFLDVRHWDASVLFVMLGAVAVYGVGYRLIIRRQKPIFAAKFEVPARHNITFELVTGAAIFGIGWGLGGYCGGPAIASLATGHAQPLIFVAAMVFGFLAFQNLPKLSSGPADKSAQSPTKFVKSMEVK